MSLNNLGMNKKSLVKNHKIAFDQDKMWLDINRELSKKKKKHRLILFFIFLLFASFSTIFISHYQSHQDKSQDLSKYPIINLPNISIARSFTTKTDLCPKNDQLVNSATPSTKLIQKHKSTNVIESFNTSNHISDQLSTTSEKFDSLHHTSINKTEPLPMLEFSQFSKISNLSTPDIVIIQKQTLKHKLLWNMGIGYVTRVLKPNNTRESAELRDLRNETEDVLEQISLGIEYKYITDSKLTYGLGIRLRQITETFQHKYFISEDLGSFDNIAMSKVTSYDYNYYNEYRFADVSTSIGYHFDLKNNINLYFDAGVSYTLVSNYNGDNLGQNLKPQHFNETKYFTNQVQSNLNAIVSYNLSKNHAISFSNSITIGMTGFNPQNSMLTQRYNIYSANIGIIRLFGQ
jgi:hypothetical protein